MPEPACCRTGVGVASRVAVEAPVRIPPRYEFKYLVPVSMLPALREALAATCALDPYAVRAPENRYHIHSLYLDSTTLAFHRAKVDRQPRRLKLRVRYYPDAPEAGAFLEIKRRIQDIIVKRRVRVPAEGWAERILERPEELGPVEEDFRTVLLLHDARPTTLVRYAREAWVSEVDDYARVTFDSALEYQPHPDWELDDDPGDWRSADDPATLGVPRSDVIVEMKFAEQIPSWMAAFGRRFDLARRGFSKYCSSIEHLYVRDRSFVPGFRIARHG